MKKSYLMVREVDQFILGCIWHDDPEYGPVPPQSSPIDGVKLVDWDGNFDRSQHSETSAAHWIDGGVLWTESASLDDQRADKNAQINAAWIRADSAAFEYAGEQFRAGADDVLRLNSINGYISLMNEMPPDWIGAWKTMGDTFIALPDVDSWKPFYTAFVMKGVTNYLAAQGLKARLAAATTAAEIAAIHWPE